ncbi:YOR342C [Saccharomyces arboricola H-6]|uniref:YOR342C n=1 Tax=Saccharomyces arboricola (strain H-6 / AS 2.3317 / CBS 10644) TaxID=1160507 RepID=J8PVW7_SACAR|nr:YOR342C [Saccharomyces arboricola H-6]
MTIPEQLNDADIPQRLDNHIFFGSIHSLAQTNFLVENNIRYFINVDIPTEILSYIYHELRPNLLDEIVIVNIDNNSQIPMDNDLVRSYHWHNTSLLQQLIHHLDFLSGININGEPLTPPPESHYRNAYVQFDHSHDPISALDKLLYGNKSEYSRTNIFPVANEAKFQVFNDLITIFKCSIAQNGNNSSNILVLSENGSHDENLISLLMSTVLKANPTFNVYQALQFVKSISLIPDTVRDEKILWATGFINYQELIKKNEMYWGLGSQKGVKSTLFASPISSVERKQRKRDDSHIIKSKLPQQKQSPFCSLERPKRARSD